MSVDKLITPLSRRCKLSETAVIMVLALGGLGLLLAAVGLAVNQLWYAFEPPLSFLLGLLIGCAHSVIKVILLEKSMQRAVQAEEKTARNYAVLQSLLRYGLTILVLLTPVLFPRAVGVFGVVAGVLSLQLAAYITTAVLKDRVLDELPARTAEADAEAVEVEQAEQNDEEADENKSIWEEIL